MPIYSFIDPVAFHIGSWPIYWYGLMYLLSFAACWTVLAWRIKRNKNLLSPITSEQLSDLVFYIALGVILGGRLGYMIFYNWQGLFVDPLLIFQTWKGGMSFHGGLIGVIIAMLFYARKNNLALINLTDFIAPAIPIGLAAGRLGNFINGELWGHVTTAPWGIIFPNAGQAPRHPSQLYELILEGVVLFIILWLFSRSPRPRGAVSGLFLLGYGLFRCSSEFFREPDIQIGYIAFDWVTEGQLLSLPMIMLGIGLLIWAYRRKGIAT
ncbi:MAG: prolipoprotein diacylglyceryl transferase [Gammaproteobacteria bacterium RIFCSPHIGHO2_12_FULL_41_20]|nr:MAG: prolipoprotein diacylglyceryl transferase [Gammaproteobacteria bacterium RIFCSPHIGHO2_12_FULL_41_20]